MFHINIDGLLGLLFILFFLFFNIIIIAACIYIIKIYSFLKNRFEIDDIEIYSRLYERRDSKNEKE